jgi:GNAT superfamily N-acetyltransferase
VTIVSPDPADIETLSEVIADAFHTLAPSRWLIPDPVARRKLFPRYFRLYVEHALACGLVHTTPDRTAVALWLPAGDGTPEPEPAYQERLLAITGPWTGRFRAFDSALEQNHPSSPPHEHLAVIAVRPGRQGRGTGSALLQAHLAALDRDQRPSYLEASSAHSRQLYRAHGYSDHGPPIRFARNVHMYPMWRPPLTPDQGSTP